MNAGFTLPTDFVATRLWLWVNGARQEGQIQDRTLANQQYNQIVNRRRDPALLEFYGAGSYSLRVFPAKSNQSRTIAIEFRHTFDDDSAAFITACIPVTFDTLQSYYNGGQPATGSIGFVQARFSATDGRTYTASVPGLGDANFSRSRTATLSGTQVRRLEPGAIMAADPSGAGAEFLWAGKDETDGLVNAGFSLELSDKNIAFDPEPDTRIIVLDIRSQFWDVNDYNARMYASRSRAYTPGNAVAPVDIWTRAQKYTVLCLQNYAACNQKFNVVIAGRSVFASPVAASADNLRAAYAAIRSARPSVSASTFASLQSAMDQAPGAAVILISDLYMPAEYYAVTNGMYSASATGAAYDTTLEDLSALVRGSSITLFTIGDEYRLVQIANKSGGFGIASLQNDYGLEYRYMVVDSRRIQFPIMPPLFGSHNPAGISTIQIRAQDFSSLIFTKDGYDYFPMYYGWNTAVSPMVDDMPMVKRAAGLGKMALPPEYYGSTALLRVAGKIGANRLAGAHEFSITGKMGGLSFRKSVSAISEPDARTFAIDKEWPFRFAEYLAADDWTAWGSQVKAIGKTYHIVTRQTSLLALEPGMAMWEDTLVPAAQAGSTGNVAGGVRLATVSADAVYLEAKDGAAAPQTSSTTTGMNIDNVGLDELISAPMGVITGQQGRGPAVATVRMDRAKMEISLPLADRGFAAAVRVYDLAGRLVLARQLTALETAAGRIVLPLGDHVDAAGTYALRLTAGGMERQFRISVH
jgi:hypothetical protein